jgi:hypothetical protein
MLRALLLVFGLEILALIGVLVRVRRTPDPWRD